MCVQVNPFVPNAAFLYPLLPSLSKLFNKNVKKLSSGKVSNLTTLSTILHVWFSSKIDIKNLSPANHLVGSVRIRSFSGPYFPVFGRSISPYSIQMRENTGQKNSEKGTFYAVNGETFFIYFSILCQNRAVFRNLNYY